MIRWRQQHSSNSSTSSNSDKLVASFKHFQTQRERVCFTCVTSTKYRYLHTNVGSKSRRMTKVKYLKNRIKYSNKVFVLCYFPPLQGSEFHTDVSAETLVEAAVKLSRPRPLLSPDTSRGRGRCWSLSSLPSVSC